VIEAKERHSVTNAAVSNLLSTLVKADVVGKVDGKHAIEGALLVNGVREEALPE
jgi:hypothetical protein